MYALMTTLTSTTPTVDTTVFQNIDFSALTTVASTLAASIIPIVVVVAAYKAGVGMIKGFVSKAR